MNWKMATRFSHDVLAALRGLAIAILLLCNQFAGHALAQADGEPVAPLSEDARKDGLRLVRQLGSPSFDLRQQASRELWELGEPALEVLQTAADGNFNKEAKMRANDLISFIKVGLAPDADVEVVQCIAGFFDRELSVQTRAIKKLCVLRKQKTARNLIALVDSETDRTSLLASCSIASSDAQMALRLGDDEAYKEWIRDPATVNSQRLLFYYTLWIDGELEPEIERLQKEALVEIEAAKAFDAEQAKQKDAKKDPAEEGSGAEKPPQTSLNTLIGLLRFLERWDEALELANQVHEPSTRRQLHHSILKESGNWKAFAALAVNSEDEQPDDDDDDDDEDEAVEDRFDGLGHSATSYAIALMHFYAGNEEQFQKVLSKIEAKIEEQKEEARKRGGQPVEGDMTHARFLRYTLDFDRSLKYAPLKKDSETFQMLSEHRRYDKLFELFGFDSFESRAKYFKGRSRRIRSLVRQMEFQPLKKDHYQEKLNLEIANWRSVCGLFATLGLNEEAELYFRRLYFDYREEIDYLRGTIVADLQSMNALDSAWEIAKIEFERDSSFAFGNMLNPMGYGHLAADFLNGQLREKISDPYERCRKIATLIRSPTMPDEEEIDFWEEMAEIDFSVSSEAIWQLFTIWDVEEEDLIDKSAVDDDTERSAKLMKQGKYLQAARIYEAQALKDDNNLYFAKAWDAYSKGGDAAKARRLRLLFVMSFDPYDAYDYAEGYLGTDWQSLPFDAYRLHDALENSYVGSNCYYMWRIAADDTKAVLSAHQKMVRTQILRYQYIDSPYLEDSEKDHSRMVEGALQAGDLKSARRWFEMLSKYQPADSGFVEDSFPAFDKVGSDEVVGEMFDKVSADFYQILKSYPDSAMYLNNYAWACACSNRNLTNGIEVAKRAIELRPATAGYLDTLAELYHRDGQHDLAIETIRKAVRINPMRPYYREQLEKYRNAKEKASQ